MSFELSALTKERLSLLYPDLRVLMTRVYQDMYRIHGLTMYAAETLRSFEKQEEIYASGRTVKGPILTNAKPGMSFHAYGLACDSCFSKPDPWLAELDKTDPKRAEFLWSEYGRISKAHGLRWGGDFKLKNGTMDLPHVEQSYGLRVDECLELYGRGGIAAVWAQIDLLRGVEIGTEWSIETMKEKENG